MASILCTGPGCPMCELSSITAAEEAGAVDADVFTAAANLRWVENTLTGQFKLLCIDGDIVVAEVYVGDDATKWTWRTHADTGVETLLATATITAIKAVKDSK